MNPIRPEVHTLVDFESPETMTLRQAPEWYKRLVRAELGVPTAMERQYMNERWAILVTAIAKREGVPAGHISYWLSELVEVENRLLTTATGEAAAALAYGQQNE